MAPAASWLQAATVQAPERPRARDIGVAPGIFQPGRYNAITDVAGVKVGHTTVWEGKSIRTGVTVILPHDGNLYDDRVPAAIYVANGFGKLLGITQVDELGELETPIALTCTLCVWQVANAMVDHLLAQPGMDEVRSINPVVGETNDGFLNDIRSRPIKPEHVISALVSARSGFVEEGAVGAGTGTRAFGWKGGIGTSSRVLPAALGGWTVGVLVQSNFGGILEIMGAPVGVELGRYLFRDTLEPSSEPEDRGDGSIMIVAATDAPITARNLHRLALRSVHGLARTGSPSTNGSGDYVIAFSTAEGARRRFGEEPTRTIEDLRNDGMSALFEAAVEATEEAIYNSLFKAVTVDGYRGRVEALPIERTLQVLREHGVVGR
ncbi:MAG: P1 family peptidase [Gemmatimonadota bacterium]